MNKSLNKQKPRVYGGTVSPYVRKVRVALAYKGVEFEDVEQTPFGATAEFRELSPLSKIPVWQEGDFVLPDSSVILSYIEQRYPAPPPIAHRPTAPCQSAVVSGVRGLKAQRSNGRYFFRARR